MSLLKVDKLCSGYNASQVLFDASIEVESGEIVTLVGRNGMGKTTMLNSIMGLVSPHSGKVMLNNHQLENQQPFVISRAGLSLVPEGRQIFPNLSTYENLVATASDANGSNTSWTLDDVLQLFPLLANRLSSMGNLLSGGEQQMLAIGRALMTNPAFLLLDDATEGLAPQIRQEIWRCLARLKDDGIGMIVVDKNINDLLPIASHHYVMEKGRIVWHGNSADWQQQDGIRQRYLGI